MGSNETRIRLQPEEYKVATSTETIRLLPREYALFAFLYEHRNQAFSRTELLDRVWGLEDPTDRTVDDHVYRLRKKLKAWDDLLTIETVRGYGYKLTLKEKGGVDHPLLLGEEFQEHVRKLIEKYHGIGMGDAMLMMAANRETLGIELPPFYRVYIPFVSGDFHWLVETDALTFWEKAPYLLFIFSHVQFDAGQALHYYERMLQHKHKLPREWLPDLEITGVRLYAEAGRYANAKAKLAEVEPMVAAMHSPSFTLVLLVDKLLLCLFTQEKGAASIIREAGRTLADTPMRRELGSFTVARGLACYQAGDKAEARRLLDEGIGIVKRTRFVPHLIFNVRIILLYLRQFDVDAEWRQKYEQMWQSLAKQYRFAELVQKIFPLLRAHL
ncbi:winged helix-turn-helix transcriptional regulator [Brevibacillus sp. SYP-B805]|uniref:winged helix-turn-helix domain-containing protein n=1 Tax=Brevibacillus sp. SYP-B805 TaxID=1578199 RepID=UPI0013EC8E05|nr:winged helix-turn-helix domain-containing protein [Brevibacillus sp. SYP-B805]NGQ96673.1 winged helix-turn-helix transcriptional regulator [Brevibacillus sp. SYP-B805]